MGIVGDPVNRAQVQQVATHATIVAEADEGWEQLTLHAVHEYAQAHPEHAVLYAHTKGSYNTSPRQHWWRQKMTEGFVKHWPDALAKLDEHDVVGPRWTTNPAPHFSGNFWMARCSYLTTLPACPETRRHDAELWVASGSPRACEMGW